MLFSHRDGSLLRQQPKADTLPLHARHNLGLVCSHNEQCVTAEKLAAAADTQYIARRHLWLKCTIRQLRSWLQQLTLYLGQVG